MKTKTEQKNKQSIKSNKQTKIVVAQYHRRYKENMSHLPKNSIQFKLVQVFTATSC